VRARSMQIGYMTGSSYCFGRGRTVLAIRFLSYKAGDGDGDGEGVVVAAFCLSIRASKSALSIACTMIGICACPEPHSSAHSPRHLPGLSILSHEKLS